MAIKKVYETVEGLEGISEDIKNQLIDNIKSEFSTVSQEAADRRIKNEDVTTQLTEMQKLIQEFTQTANPDADPSKIDVNDFKRMGLELKDLNEFKRTALEKEQATEKKLLLANVEKQLNKQLVGFPDEAVEMITKLHSQEFVKTAAGVIQTPDGKTVEQRASELLKSYEGLKPNPMPNGGGILNSNSGAAVTMTKEQIYLEKLRDFANKQLKK